MKQSVLVAVAAAAAMAIVAPTASADSFKPATGKNKKAIASIAKKRGFSGIYAVLIAKKPNGSTRFAVACGNGPGARISSPAKRKTGGKWRGHNPTSSGALQTYDLACVSRKSNGSALAAASRLHLPTCGNSFYGAAVKPRSWNPGCAGSSPQFQNLRWSGWGRKAARGYGTARICQLSGCQTVSGKIIATRIRRCEGPKTTVRMYTRTTLRLGSRVYRQGLVCQ